MIRCRVSAPRASLARAEDLACPLAPVPVRVLAEAPVLPTDSSSAGAASTPSTWASGEITITTIAQRRWPAVR